MLEFAEKAGTIPDLYGGDWEGERLHPGDYVVCRDEKPSIQARSRKHGRASYAYQLHDSRRVDPPPDSDQRIAYGDCDAGSRPTNFSSAAACRGSFGAISVTPAHRS